MVHDIPGFLGQDCDTASDGSHLLPCLGWSEGYLDGLYKTSQYSIRIANFYHRLVVNLRYLGF